MGDHRAPATRAAILVVRIRARLHRLLKNSLPGQFRIRTRLQPCRSAPLQIGCHHEVAPATEGSAFLTPAILLPSGAARGPSRLLLAGWGFSSRISEAPGAAAASPFRAGGPHIPSLGICGDFRHVSRRMPDVGKCGSGRVESRRATPSELREPRDAGKSVEPRVET